MRAAAAPSSTQAGAARKEKYHGSASDGFVDRTLAVSVQGRQTPKEKKDARIRDNAAARERFNAEVVTGLLSLPNELLFYIAGLLPPRMLAQLAAVGRRFRYIVRDPLLHRAAWGNMENFLPSPLGEFDRGIDRGYFSSWGQYVFRAAIEWAKMDLYPSPNTIGYSLSEWSPYATILGRIIANLRCGNDDQFNLHPTEEATMPPGNLKERLQQLFGELQASDLEDIKTRAGKWNIRAVQHVTAPVARTIKIPKRGFSTVVIMTHSQLSSVSQVIRADNPPKPNRTTMPNELVIQLLIANPTTNTGPHYTGFEIEQCVTAWNHQQGLDVSMLALTSFPYAIGFALNLRMLRISLEFIPNGIPEDAWPYFINLDTLLVSAGRRTGLALSRNVGRLRANLRVLVFPHDATLPAPLDELMELEHLMVLELDPTRTAGPRYVPTSALNAQKFDTPTNLVFPAYGEIWDHKSAKLLVQRMLRVWKQEDEHR